MGQWGETQLNDLLGALADLTLNTQTHQSYFQRSYRTHRCQSSGYCQLRSPTWISGVRVGRSKVNTDVDPEVRRSTLSRLLYEVPLAR